MAKASVTIRDVALEAGVSKTTAVYVLNNASHLKVPDTTRQRVLTAARHLGYQRNGVAAALSRGRLETVGAVLSHFDPVSESALSNIYVKDAISAVAEAAAEIGLRMTVMAVPPNSAPSVEAVVDKRVDGLILISLQNDYFTRAVYATGFPCVTIGSGYAERRIRVDDQGGGRAAAEHLIALGHRRLCYAFDGRNSGRAAQDRLAGFLDAAACHGLRLGHEVQVANDNAALDLLLALPLSERPTAVLAFNDVCAWTIVTLARKRGIAVPNDLSIIGYDNNILAETCFPPLTTVANPLRAQAEAALKVLQALWNGDQNPPEPPLIAMPLIVRESTCAPSQKEGEL